MNLIILYNSNNSKFGYNISSGGDCPSITDETMDRLSSEYKVQLKRCQQCYVVRPPRVHHCSICKGCIMKMDHHCPWINNCIGQFTQKFFILLCGYSFCGCCETIIIVLYYMVYKSHMVGTSWKMIMLIRRSGRVTQRTMTEQPLCYCLKRTFRIWQQTDMSRMISFSENCLMIRI